MILSFFKKILPNVLSIILALFFAAIPKTIFAAGGLVPCDGPDCNFCSLVTLANNVIHFIIVGLAVPIASLLFAYAGWLYLSSGGETGKRNQAKQIFLDVLIGFLFILFAWLIINLIMQTFGQSSWSNFAC